MLPGIGRARTTNKPTNKLKKQTHISNDPGRVGRGIAQVVGRHVVGYAVLPVAYVLHSVPPRLHSRVYTVARHLRVVAYKTSPVVVVDYRIELVL